LSTTEQRDFFIFNIYKGKKKRVTGIESLLNDRIAKPKFLLEQLRERKHTTGRGENQIVPDWR
jgi:hypothetical protein